MNKRSTVLLIGTNHANQLCGRTEGTPEAFRAYLERVCKIRDVDVIAEELSEDALSLWRATDSTCRLLANQLGIEHVFCDPGKEDRARLNLSNDEALRRQHGYSRFLSSSQLAHIDELLRAEWAVRERFWLDRLRTCSFSRCLFVVGADHVMSFFSLLRDESVHAEVTHAKWSS